MTLTDTDLEARLRRDLHPARTRVAPPPADLAATVRARSAAERRRQLRLAASGLALAVLLVGLPLASNAVIGTEQAATPAPQRELLPVDDPLYLTPTRGGLAGDDAWLAAVAELSWQGELTDPRDPGMELAPPDRDTRRVAYADDVPSGRVALVVGLRGRTVTYAWFVGPTGAEPGEMRLAEYPGMQSSDTVALVDAPSSDTEALTLIAVTAPGNRLERALLPVVGADGTVTRGTETLAVQDGVAVLAVERHWAAGSAGLTVVDGTPSTQSFALTESRRAGVARWPDVVPADPRGQALPDEPDGLPTRMLGHLLATFGIGAHESDAVLLAAGPLAEGTGRVGQLVGVTFPSGATGAWLMTWVPGDADTGMSTSEVAFAPAGTALLDRLIAVSSSGGLLVSAPGGTQALALDAAGAVVTTVPLRDGAGSAPLPTGAEPVTVRVLDADGTVVAEGAVESA